VLGAGPAALGALDGAADLAAAGVKLGAGRLADHPALAAAGRRRLRDRGSRPPADRAHRGSGR
jgi:hypothetical protein